MSEIVRESNHVLSETVPSFMVCVLSFMGGHLSKCDRLYFDVLSLLCHRFGV